VCPASAKPRFCPILTPSQHPNRFSRSCLREHGDRHRVTMAVPRTACTVRTGCTPQARRVPLSRSTRRKRRTQSRRGRSAAGRPRPEGIVASRAPWPQHTNEPQTPRACSGAVRVARHRPASPGSCAAMQCTSRTAPRARRARRAAPTHARRRVPRCVPGPGVCGAPVPGSGVRPARCASRLPVPGVPGVRVPGVRHSRGNLAPVSSLNRMETGARYEYRSLISRISQPTFAKMATAPNFLAQWRRSPGGDGPQIW
jgi:hypothetical protein